MAEIESLIVDYMGEVESSLSIFEQKYGRRDIVLAANSGVFAKSGNLTDGIEYTIHGYGCRLEFSDGHVVDFDLSPTGDAGFEEYRLWKYAEHLPQRYPEFRNVSDVKMALDRAIAKGRVVLANGSDYLYRLT